MSEYTELAKECGATLTISQGENGWFNDSGAIFQKEQLTAFAEAIRRKTLEEAIGKVQSERVTVCEDGDAEYNVGISDVTHLLRIMAQEGVTK